MNKDKAPMTRRIWAGRIYAVDIGRDIEANPELREFVLDLYRNMFVRQILELPFLLERFPGASKTTLRGGITLALHGYDGSDRVAGGDSYKAIMSQEEREEIKKKVRRWRGNELRENYTGTVLWSDAEISDLLEWRLLPEFRRTKYTKHSSHDSKKLADAINEKYHDGKPIRTSIAVNIYLLRMNKSLQESTGEGLPDNQVRYAFWTEEEKALLREIAQRPENIGYGKDGKYFKIKQIGEEFHRRSTVTQITRSRNSIVRMIKILFESEGETKEESVS